MLKESAYARQDAQAGAPLSMAEQVRLAEMRGWQSAYERHRARIHSQRGAPVLTSRGRGDCLALVLLPLALLLLAVHPLVAIPVLVIVGWLYLRGSSRLLQERAQIAAADAEALRLWQQAGHPLPSGLEAPPGAVRPREADDQRRHRR